MSDKQESIVIVKEPQRLYDAIQAFRSEAESIEFQRIYGDQARPPLKQEFDEAMETLVTYFRHQNGVLSEVVNRIVAIEEQLNQITTLLEPITSWLLSDMEEDQTKTDCACSECGCGGWWTPTEVRELIYGKADAEDGVQAKEPALTLEMLQDADAYTVEPGSRMPAGLSDDECNCERCRPRSY